MGNIIIDKWPKIVDIEEIARRCESEFKKTKEDIELTLANDIELGLLEVTDKKGMNILRENVTVNGRIVSVVFKHQVLVRNDRFRQYLIDNGHWPISTESEYCELLPWFSSFDDCPWPATLDIGELAKMIAPCDKDEEKATFKKLAYAIQGDLLPSPHKNRLSVSYGDPKPNGLVYVKRDDFQSYLKEANPWPIPPTHPYIVLKRWFSVLKQDGSDTAAKKSDSPRPPIDDKCQQDDHTQTDQKLSSHALEENYPHVKWRNKFEQGDKNGLNACRVNPGKRDRTVWKSKVEVWLIETGDLKISDIKPSVTMLGPPKR